MSSSKTVAAAVIVLLLKKRKRERKKRQIWVRYWIQRRSSLGAHERLLGKLRREDPQQLQNFLRMNAEDFDFLLNLVTTAICKEDTNMREAITPSERLSITLRFLTTGDSYHSLMYLYRIPVCTIARIVPECCQAIQDVLQESYLKVPTSADEWIRIASDFANIWNFPHCVGALDGKHVVIQAPPCSGSHYFNYKGTHSIVLMALADANYKLIYVNIGCNGRVSDGGVFNRCALSVALEQNTINLPPPEPLPGRYKPSPYVIVADDAFAMKPYLLKPFSFKNQPAPNRIFSYRLSRARRVIENVFGLMATRFRILRRPIQLDPARVKKVVGAICVLHNFLITRKESRGNYAPPLIIDTENPDGTIIEGTWRQEGLPGKNLLPMEQHGHNFSQNAKSIREEFRDYFMSSEGEVYWQYKCI